MTNFHSLFITYKNSLMNIIACPYCSKRNQDDPILGCCGEVHAEPAYQDSQGNIILEYELKEHFNQWLSGVVTEGEQA